MLRNPLQKPCAILLKFMLSHAGYLQHFCLVLRTQAAHKHQGHIRKYNVRRHTLFPCDLGPQAAQRLEKEFFLLRENHGSPLF